jgi:hypothetical protein
MCCSWRVNIRTKRERAGSATCASRPGFIMPASQMLFAHSDVAAQWQPATRISTESLSLCCATSALPPLGLSDFDLWILAYVFLGNERDSHAPTRTNREHPAEFGE